MNCVNITFSSSKVFSGFDIIAVRCGYLLGDKVLFAGDVHLGVYAEHYYSKHGETLRKKLEYLIYHIKGTPIEGLTSEQLEMALQTCKAYQKLKHLRPQQIIAQTKFERAYDKVYQQVMAPFMDAFERAGYIQLSYLVDEGIVLAEIEDKDRELEKETNKKGVVKLSTVLQDRFGSENPNDIYLVTHEFNDFIKEQNLMEGSLAENGGEENAQILSAPLFQFPSINQFKATELQSIRKNIHVADANFRKSMNEWSKALKTVPFEPGALAEIRHTFQTQIAPELEPIQRALDSDERIELSHRSHNYTFQMTAILHVCPVKLYWQYLASINSLGEETRKVLESHPDYEKNSQTSCLLLQCNHRNVEQKNPREIVEDMPAISKRKTLEIE